VDRDPWTWKNRSLMREEIEEETGIEIGRGEIEVTETEGREMETGNLVGDGKTEMIGGIETEEIGVGMLTEVERKGEDLLDLEEMMIEEIIGGILDGGEMKREETEMETGIGGREEEKRGMEGRMWAADCRAWLMEADQYPCWICQTSPGQRTCQARRRTEQGVKEIIMKRTLREK